MFSVTLSSPALSDFLEGHCEVLGRFWFYLTWFQIHCHHPELYLLGITIFMSYSCCAVCFGFSRQHFAQVIFQLYRFQVSAKEMAILATNDLKKPSFREFLHIQLIFFRIVVLCKITVNWHVHRYKAGSIVNLIKRWDQNNAIWSIYTVRFVPSKTRSS